MQLTIRVYIIVAALLTLATQVHSQECSPITLPKVLIPNGLPGDDAGTTVALYGDFLFIGSTLANRDGEVNIFEYDGSNYIHTQKLTYPLSDNSNRFGLSLDAYGSTLVVGSNNEAVHVYDYDGESWINTANLAASDGEVSDNFGDDVAIWDKYIVIGAEGDDDNGSRAGAVYIFKYDGQWSEIKKLTAPDASTGALFGISVDLWGNRLAIGAAFDNAAGFRSGAAYIYENTDDEWSYQHTIRPNDLLPEDHFGAAVSIWGDTFVASTWRDEAFNRISGSVYIYEYDKPNWIQVDELRSDSTVPTYFGRQLETSLDTIVIGAPDDADVLSFSGAAYLYRRSQGVWALDSKLKADVPGAGDNFGTSLAVFGDTIAVGAPDHTALGSQSGATYVFKTLCPDSCVADIDGDGTLAVNDLEAWISAYQCGSANADQNGDGYITPADFTAWINNFNLGCDTKD